MKTTLLVLICLPIISLLHAQYTVTKITGRVKTNSGSYLSPGGSLSESDTIIFSSYNDKLWIIIPGTGEKIVTPSATAKTVTNGISQLLSDAIFSDPKVISLRAGVSIIEKIPEAIKSDNEPGDKIIVEKENKFLFNPTDYPQNDEGIFFLQIDRPSEKTIIQPLRASGDTLVIYYTDFLTESDNPSNQYKLAYHNYHRGSSQLVALIKPYFDLTNEMEAIIQNTVVTYKKENMQEDSLRVKAYNNVYRISGKPNGLLFSSLFTKYWLGNIADTQKLEKRGTGNTFDETDFLAVPQLSNLVTTSRDGRPSNFSLRQYAPPVGDQGAFSTCAAWASAYATRTIAFAVSHDFTVNNNYDKIISNTFSPDFVYNNVQPSGNCYDGSSLMRSLNFIKKNGSLIRTAGQFRCGRAYMINDFENAKNYRIKDFQRVNDDTHNEGDLTGKIKDLIVNKHAIAFSLVMFPSFDKVGKDGIWNPTEYEYKAMDSIQKKLLRSPGGHAMCLIGYNDAVAGGSYEIMNSWGSSFGRDGFYWINYHDFYLFSREMYTVSDFGMDTLNTVDTQSQKITNSVNADQLVIKPKADSNAVVVVPTIKPRLKGDMEFMLLNGPGSYDSVGVIEKAVNVNGDYVEITKDSGTYAYYNLAKPLYSGNRYKIKMNLTQASYVYIMGADAKSPYYLFPQKNTESPLINFTNATLYLPNDKEHYTLNNEQGKEKMCILLSKSPIDVDTIYNQFSAADNNIYKVIRQNLQGRLLDMTNVKYAGNKIDFDKEVTDNNVLAFFIEITHL